MLQLKNECPNLQYIAGHEDLDTATVPASDDPNKMVFRKRVLHQGSSIGYHLQREDEIYYILSGNGNMKMNGELLTVSAGDAILTRGGSSHSLTPSGKDGLALIIAYLAK